MAPNKDYWIRRAEQLEQRAAEQGETLIRQALSHYKRAAQEISSQIEEFYGRYAAEQGLSYAEAVKVLRGADARQWAKTLGEYVEEIGALPDGALKDRLKAELNARAYSSRITRLDALKAQVDMEVDRLMVNLENEMREGFGDLYTDSYYRKMYDIQRHAGKMFDFAHLDRELVEQALSYPWSGADFSSRLWENKRALLFHLREIMTQGAIQGKGVAVLSKELADKLGQSFRVAERLIRTEANHFHNAADVAAYEAAGVRQYEFIATLDSRTSAVCAGLDGKVFDIKDARTGVNYPPMHPWCRSTTVEYDPDEWKDWEAIGQPMPKRMTYDQWAAEQGIEVPGVLNGAERNGKIKAKIEFAPAKTIKEADEYAKTVLGVPNVSYKGVDIDTANEWNCGLADSFGRFPELKNNFGFVGEAHERNIGVKPLIRQYYADIVARKYPDLPPDLAKKFVDTNTSKAMRSLSVSKHSMAQSWSPPADLPFGSYRGVTVNRDFGKNADDFAKALMNDVNIKFHPAGCDTIRSVLDHEIGHQLDDILGISGVPEVQRLFDVRTKQQITDDLSRYAWDNGNKKRYSEMIAEAWAEYCNNPEPREIAKAVGEAIERRYREMFG